MNFAVPAHRLPQLDRYRWPVLVYCILQLADATSTVAVLENVPSAAEGNPFMAALMAAHGYSALFAVKVAGTLLVMLASWLMLANYAVRHGPARRPISQWLRHNFVTMDVWSYRVSCGLMLLVVVNNVANLLIHPQLIGGG